MGNQIGLGDKWQRDEEGKYLKYMHEKVGYWPENSKKNMETNVMQSHQ